MTDSKPSKSARKREYLALQKLGESLIELQDTELDSIPLEDDLRTAIRTAAGMKSHGALRRQKQLIGKLMRHVDAAPIHAALHRLGTNERRAQHLFAAAERWRDRLTRESTAALHAFETEVGAEDSELRGWLQELAENPDERTEKTLRRQIFRRLHALLSASS